MLTGYTSRPRTFKSSTNHRGPGCGFQQYAQSLIRKSSSKGLQLQCVAVPPRATIQTKAFFIHFLPFCDIGTVAPMLAQHLTRWLRTMNGNNTNNRRTSPTTGPREDAEVVESMEIPSRYRAWVSVINNMYLTRSDIRKGPTVDRNLCIYLDAVP